MTDQKQCMACGASIVGRSDKKFCDDQCRNAFNNRQNSDSNNYVRNINNTLRKNRRILEDLNTDPSGKTKIPKSRLLEKGYNFNYHTNVLHTKTGKTYTFCYEFGFFPIENEWLILVRKNESL